MITIKKRITLLIQKYRFESYVFLNRQTHFTNQRILIWNWISKWRMEWSIFCEWTKRMNDWLPVEVWTIEPRPGHWSVCKNLHVTSIRDRLGSTNSFLLFISTGSVHGMMYDLSFYEELKIQYFTLPAFYHLRNRNWQGKRFFYY